MRFLTNFQTPRDDKGVSPVVGVVLMVAITVALAAVVGIVVFDIGNNTSQNGQAALTVEQSENTMTIGINTAQTNALDYIYVTSGPNVTYSGGIDGTVDYANGPSDSSQYLYATSESGEQGGAGTQVDANYTNSSSGQVSVIGVNTDGSETVLNSYEYNSGASGNVASEPLSPQLVWNQTLETNTYDRGMESSIVTTANSPVHFGGVKGDGAYTRTVSSSGTSELWSKNNTADSYAAVADLSLDTNDNLYIAQQMRDTRGNNDVTLIKTERSSGTEIWNISYTNTNYIVKDMFIDSSDNIYLTGEDGRILQYDTDGNLVSNMTVSSSSINEMAVDDSGNIYIASGSGLKKYDSTGNEIWSTTIEAASIDINSQGETFVTESGHSTPTRVTKYDTSGSEIWNTSVPNDPFKMRAIEVGSDGSVYAAGSGFAVVKYDSSGELQWSLSEAINSEPIAGDIKVDSNNNVFVSGAIDSNTPTENTRNPIILKFEQVQE